MNITQWQLNTTRHRLAMLVLMSTIEFILGIYFIVSVATNSKPLPTLMAFVFIAYMFIMLVLNGIAVVLVSDKSYRAYRTEHSQQFQMIWTSFLLRLIIMVALSITLGMAWHRYFHRDDRDVIETLERPIEVQSTPKP